ncbi:hypothetical protein [Hwanghaeella sp.]|uniref:hypothetical protein n=1 Tax=Hwanghaeella sp. TaxID=2605943 RepID=UPI003CCB9DE5
MTIPGNVKTDWSAEHRRQREWSKWTLGDWIAAVVGILGGSVLAAASFLETIGNLP